MNINDYLDKPLFSLTVAEFLEIQKKAEQPVIVDFTEKPNKHVYGLAGIMQLFNCSRKTANRIKQSGKIDKAIQQCGRKIIVDAELALELANQNN